jgi:putative transposase
VSLSYIDPVNCSAIGTLCSDSLILLPFCCCITGLAWGFSPTNREQIERGFSPGPSLSMPLAPQEIRTYFVTAVTASRRRIFQVEKNSALLLEVLQDQSSKKRLQLHAFVIMPDHIHILLTPAPEISLEKAMQYIKGNFSFRFKSKMDVWERSYDNRRVQNTHDYLTHINYIEQNPVRARLSTDAESHQFSSANRAHITDSAPTHFT